MGDCSTFVLSLLIASAVMLASGCFSKSDPPAGWYEGCGSLDDCRVGTDECFDIRWDDGRGGMCSGLCEVDMDCPGNSACFELVGDPSATRICYQSCFDDRDCAGGFTCTDAVTNGMVVDSICLPR